MNEDMMATKRGVGFKDTLYWLATELMTARAHFSLVRGLRRLDSNVLQSAPTFFELVEGALAESTTLGLGRIFDRNRDSITIHSLLSLASSNAAAFQGGTETDVNTIVADARTIIETYEPILKALKTRRDQTVAHSDRKPMLDPGKYVEDGRVTYRQMDELFDKVGQILERFSLLYTGRSIPSVLSGADDYTNLFKNFGKANLARKE